MFKDGVNQAMVKQLSLDGMSKGKVEVVEPKAKAKPGRPPKIKDERIIEVAAKRPVGRPRKELEVSSEQQEQLLELMQDFLESQGLQGVIKQASEKAAAERTSKEKTTKITRILGKISKSLLELGDALGEDGEQIQDEAQAQAVIENEHQVEDTIVQAEVQGEHEDRQLKNLRRQWILRLLCQAGVRQTFGRCASRQVRLQGISVV